MYLLNYADPAGQQWLSRAFLSISCHLLLLMLETTGAAGQQCLSCAILSISSPQLLLMAWCCREQAAQTYHIMREVRMASLVWTSSLIAFRIFVMLYTRTSWHMALDSVTRLVMINLQSPCVKVRVVLGGFMRQGCLNTLLTYMWCGHYQSFSCIKQIGG